MVFLKIFISGFIFLFLTILVNLAANLVKLTSWYDFLRLVGTSGISKAISQVSPVSLVWLFVGYPFCLGLLVYFLRRLIS